MSEQKQLENVLQIAFNKLNKDTYKHVIIHAIKSDGTFVFHDAKGIIDSNQKPMTKDTPFNIASVTKLFIASTIFILEEEKKLSIEDKVSLYINHPIIKDPKFNENDQLTISHLLSHTSGLPDYLEIKDHHKKSLFDVIVEKGDGHWTRNDFYDRVIQYGKPYFKPQDLNKKKVKARYSDTNFQLLIDIIEKTTQQSIDQVFDEKIYQPLDLKASFHEGTKKASLYKEKASIWAGQKEMHIPKALASFGDIYSTSKDLIIFMRALITQKLFKDSNTFERMIGTWHALGFQLIPTSPGWPIQYGFGVTRLKYPSFLPPFKKIPEFYGHTGVTGSWVFFVPKYDLIVCGDVGQLHGSAVPYQFMAKLLVELQKEI